MVLLDYLYLLKHCDFRYIKLSEGRGYVSHMLHVYIYLHLVDFVRANVGKYSSTMEHMGMAALLFRPSRCVLHSLWPRWLKHLRALGQAWKLSTRCQVKAEARHLNPQRHTAPHSATQRHMQQVQRINAHKTWEKTRFVSSHSFVHSLIF